MLRTVWNKLLKLFVDDQLYAVAILVWIALVWLAIKQTGIPSAWAAGALFAGLALIFVESVSRAGRR